VEEKGAGKARSFMNSAINETYGSLLMQTRPHIIRDDDNERSIELLETLVNQDHLTPEQEELVGVLRLLIHDYEKRFVVVPGATQAEQSGSFRKGRHARRQGEYLPG
jgi:hypothetical protein